MFDSPKRIDSESDHGQPIRLKNRNQRIDFTRIDSKKRGKIFEVFLKLSNNFYTVFKKKPVQKCLEIHWVSLLLLIKDISLASKFLRL